MWCTGYHYSVPFLRGLGGFSTAQGRIEPLYRHLFHPQFGARLSFIGLGFRILPFPFFEIQSKWVARILAGRSALPSTEEMRREAEAFYEKHDTKEGARVDMTHCMDGLQWDYLAGIAAEVGMEDCQPLQDWKMKLYEINRVKKSRYPSDYRDRVMDEELQYVEQAMQEAREAIL